MKIKILNQEDWKIWKSFRFEALKNSPENFGSSYEEERNWLDTDFQDVLIKNAIFGVFIDGEMIASAGFYRLDSLKMKHRGVIWGMYTCPEYRRRGIANALMKAVIEYAQSIVKQVHITCVTSNFDAVAFYQKHGFKIYGTEPAALKIANELFDEYLMILDFTENTMNKLDTYLDLCTQVYDLSKPNPPEDAYVFYRDYVIKAKGPVLEPMCGTGRFLIPLLEEEFDVHGFDASDYMLKALHVKATAKQLKPHVWNGFAEDLKGTELYNLIFIPSGSFCLMTENSQVETALKTFYDHLNNDGIFLFEIETPKAVPTLDVWRGSVWCKPNGHRIVLSILATTHGDVCHSIGKYELIDKSHIIKTEIEEYKIRIYDTQELADMLKKTGFKHVRVLKAFDSTATPDEGDESIVYECRKC